MRKRQDKKLRRLKRELRKLQSKECELNDTITKNYFLNQENKRLWNNQSAVINWLRNPLIIYSLEDSFYGGSNYRFTLKDPLGVIQLGMSVSIPDFSNIENESVQIKVKTDFVRQIIDRCKFVEEQNNEFRYR